MNGRILYIGGFELPDKNAAAQRVLSISKALSLASYDIIFYGITKSDDYYGYVNGFEYEALQYPQSIKEWVQYVMGVGVIDYIKSKSPDYVFTYNYPTIAQERIIRYCHNHDIKVVGDITEWYMPSDFIRKLDTALRMRWSNKHLDGIIVISRFLNNFYRECNTIQLPPFVDVDEIKWKQQLDNKYPNKIKLIYAGQPGVTKDRLDYIVNGLAGICHKDLLLNIVGITKEQYIQLFGSTLDLSNIPIIFHGRLPHNETVKLLMESDFQIFFRPNLRVNNAGFPTKYVEAMTAGIPVIMNRISNVDDYLKDGYNGILIENPIESEIRLALDRVSQMTRLEINQMKSNCLRELFDYHQYVNELGTFMKRL